MLNGRDAQQNPIGDGFNDADGTESHPSLIRFYTQSSKCASNWSRTWAREFRYDGPRQRYLTRELSTTSLFPVSDQWADYVGNSPIADFEVNSGIPDDQRRYVSDVAETARRAMSFWPHRPLRSNRKGRPQHSTTGWWRLLCGVVKFDSVRR